MNARRTPTERQIRVFGRYCLGLVAYTLLIVLWGAWVRISGSGNGCGEHWPLCKGEIWINPFLTEQITTLIELAHRVKSGLLGFAVLFLFAWAWRLFPKGHAVRVSAGLTLFFTTTEALLGAGLVLFGLVGQNDSLLRAFVMSMHLINTLILLFVLSSCYFSITTKQTKFIFPRGTILICLLLIATIATLGAWAALSSTLYPSHDWLSGLAADFSNESPLIVRLRILHPLFAIALSVYGITIISALKERAHQSVLTIQILWLIQLLFGLATLLSGAPTSLKLLHLLLADLLWIRLCGLHWYSLATAPNAAPVPAGV